jgi:Fur family transcriptional regulator, ferric uptake regulator
MCKSTHGGVWAGLNPAQRATLADALRDRGLQPTLQRELIYEIVAGCPGHICAEHVLGVAGEMRPDLSINKTTVYRNLELLAELGLVRRHHCGEGPVQYESGTRGPHAHLICATCGELVDMDTDIAAELTGSIAASHSFRVDLDHYPIAGICAACSGQH